jgi:hypothetical protein
MRDIQRDRRNVVVQLLAKAIGQSREPALAHAQRKVLPFDIAGRNVLIGITAYYLAGSFKLIYKDKPERERARLTDEAAARLSEHE